MSPTTHLLLLLLLFLHPAHPLISPPTHPTPPPTFISSRHVANIIALQQKSGLRQFSERRQTRLLASPGTWKQINLNRRELDDDEEETDDEDDEDDEDDDEDENEGSSYSRPQVFSSDGRHVTPIDLRDGDSTSDTTQPTGATQPTTAAQPTDLLEEDDDNIADDADNTSSDPSFYAARLNNPSSLRHKASNNPFLLPPSSLTPAPKSTPEAPVGPPITVGSAGGWTLEIIPGDYVVHKKYGIGRFTRSFTKPRKLSRKEKSEVAVKLQAEIYAARRNGRPPPSSMGDTMGEQVLTLEIEYADGILHVPAHRAFRLSRYRSSTVSSSLQSLPPRLSRMTGTTWSKNRDKVAQSASAIAEEVLALYATREQLKREPYRQRFENGVKEFESTFVYEATADQVRCFSAVENDMVYKARPMDRLICGDVGFGKTEVALRAIYRCVANGRQAALLAPTSVLAAQHYKNVAERMGPFGVKVELLRGSAHGKGMKGIVEGIKDGQVQLAIGTHALLNKDIRFKDLGLLVIDEEQRFGVKQKERLKMICGGIDVLTLSATPIPRTLQMSLSGIRDTSTIRSAPPMRLPIKTEVREFDLDVLKKAVENELERGGQCFFVVPRIAMLSDSQTMLELALPGIRVLTAHGRMGRGCAEEAVAAFAEGKSDVLLATTVIENGIDIPSVNTIVVMHAHTFGMSTLYQLRGRVGRSNKQAYAFMFYPEESSITEAAYLRLKAMQDLTTLGCGFDLASRDLEIRGAGSLFGVEQSGMAGRVGFDLYMRMLRKAIKKLKGLAIASVARTRVFLPNQEGGIEGAMRFTLPVSYVPDDKQREHEENEARLAETSARLMELTKGWQKSYGDLDESVKGDLKKLHLHSCTRILGVDEIHLSEKGAGILRSPGLRRRQWDEIVFEMKEVEKAANITKGAKPVKGVKGLGAVFPARVRDAGAEEERKQQRDSWDGEAEPNGEADWDEMDDEEEDDSTENLKEGVWEGVPHFVIKGLGKVEEGKRVEKIVKVLLPVVTVVLARQKMDAASALEKVKARDVRLQAQTEKAPVKNTKGYYVPDDPVKTKWV